MIQIVNGAMQIPQNERVIGVQGDHLTQKRVFSISKIVNGLDLSTFTPLLQLQANYPTHPPYFDVLQMEIDGENLLLTWDIADHDTNSKGNLYFQVQFSKAYRGEVIIYQTLKDLFIVAPSIEAREEYEDLPPDVFEQYMKQVQFQLEELKLAMENEYKQWSNELQVVFDGWLANNQVTFEEWLMQGQSSFDKWFEELNVILSGDVAANLAAEILKRPRIIVIPKDNDIPVAERLYGSWYYKVTDTQSGGVGIADSIKVSPNMGLKMPSTRSKSGIDFD